MRTRNALLFSLIAFGLGCDDVVGPADRHYIDVTTGGYHTCAIAESGEAFCWGKGSDGQLGTGQTSDRSTPAAVQTSTRFKQISAGAAHTCAIGTDDRAWCWGWSALYQTGDTSSYPHLVPEKVPLDSTIIQIAAGGYHTCALTATRSVFCWGYNRWGQTGNRSTETTIYPIPVAGNFLARSITAGGHHTCAIAMSGGAYCWGSNEFGQLGIGREVPLATEPTFVVNSARFAAIDAGENHTCARDASQYPFCWGYNEFGQVGDGVFWRPGLTGRHSPVSVFQLESIIEIAAGTNHSCATDVNRRTYCWGRGLWGQLGVGSRADQAVRQIISYQPGSQYRADYLVLEKLAAGGYTHMCGLAEGTVFCWGTGHFGELGNGKTIATIPQPITR